MLDATASETALAKRVNDTDRVQTRATRLKITSGWELAGAALRGEVRVGDYSLLPAGYLRRFLVFNMLVVNCCKGRDEFCFCNGEGAIIHINDDAARRCDLTLVIALLWRFEMVRRFQRGLLRRDRECTGPR